MWQLHFEATTIIYSVHIVLMRELFLGYKTLGFLG
jgi:hypothetical protein